MYRRGAVLALALVAALGWAGDAWAQSTPEVSVSAVDSALLGERFVVRIEVRTAPGTTVEVDPTAPSWGSLEVLAVSAEAPARDGAVIVHRLDVTVAVFGLGDAAATPRILLIDDGRLAALDAPPLSVAIVPSLAPEADLELVPLPGPSPVAAPSRDWVTPVAAAAGFVATSALLTLLAVAVRRLRGRAPRRAAQGGPVRLPLAAILPAEADTLSDPVTAYRAIATSVRQSLADRYDFPALALSTGELSARMESQGVDRWQARLVRGLLENCDAVVYAGYRPAPERRRADLDVAREIVGEPA